MSKEEDLKTIQLRIIDAKARMNDCLSAGKFNVAETYLDQTHLPLTSGHAVISNA